MPFAIHDNFDLNVVSVINLERYFPVILLNQWIYLGPIVTWSHAINFKDLVLNAYLDTPIDNVVSY